MRRTTLSLAVVALCAAAGLVAWFARPTQARPDLAADKAARKIPLTQAVLFNTGIGHFQRSGEFDGNGRIELVFPVGDVNDLLKSLVVDDGGKPGAVGYDGTEPVEQTLKSFSLDLTGNPTLGQLLNQARGQKAEVTLDGQPGAPAGPLSGTIVGMEASVGKDSETHALNLLCGDGVRRLPLDRVQRVRFLDPVLETEFKQALALLAAGGSNQRRRVWCDLRGDGKREVRISYVHETPVWKASYRLDVGAKPTLGASAIVENTTDEDWKDIKLTLVAGRPITFEMDLAKPLFVPRPPVEPQFYASLKPPSHMSFGGFAGFTGGQLGRGFNIGGGGFNFGGVPTPAKTPAPMGTGGAFGMTGVAWFFQGSPVNRYQVSIPSAAPSRKTTFEDLVARRQELIAVRAEGKPRPSPSMAEAVEDLAVDASRIGEGFRKTVEQKVSIPRQTSALLPLHSGPVEMSRFSVFNPAVHPRFPLHAVRLKNTTGQPLLQGPASVTENGSYVGDCRLPDMAPGDERIVSWAMDLGVEVRRQVGELEPQKPEVRLSKGRVLFTPLTHRATYYTFTNRSKLPRTVVVEHAKQEGWTTRTKPTGSTETASLFQYKTLAGAPSREVVDEELRGTTTALELRRATVPQLEDLLKSPHSDEFKDALEKVVDLRAKAERAAKETAKAATESAAVAVEQAKLRERIDRLPMGSPALKRLQEEFAVQESQLDKLGKALLALREAEAKAARELENFSASASAK
ncbi:MAG: DUF4139 domain-containing protein [Gemmataceae bacterium]|nr:DUF4139 domain-containing protein [Gemmataceae bacterium]